MDQLNNTMKINIHILHRSSVKSIQSIFDNKKIKNVRPNVGVHEVVPSVALFFCFFFPLYYKVSSINFVMKYDA